MSKNHYFNVCDMDIHASIASNLEGEFSFQAEGAAKTSRVYYDTFDWLLYAKSQAIYYTGDEYFLAAIDDDSPTARATAHKPVSFASELPAGSLRSKVRSVITSRALLEKASITLLTTTYRILNDDEKTVARIICTESQPEPEVMVSPLDDSRLTCVDIRPVRGYAKGARQLARLLHSQLNVLPSASFAEADIYDFSMRIAGLTPGGYTSRLEIQLDPEMRSDETARMILRRLLQTLRDNEDGIRSDIDIEFLHDYRVAIRRTRSALSQFRGVFSPSTADHWKQRFRTLGQFTNELRDLDVYLLAQSEYCAMIPDNLRDDIAPLFEYLRAQRAHALASVVAHLDSPERAQTLDEWEAFISEHSPSDDLGPNADVPAIELSKTRLDRRYWQIVKHGRLLLQDAEDEQLHALRIDCKKLRYLLEFFESLYPPKKTKRLVRELKRLQDNLGDFNDLSVQQNYLMGVANKLPMDDQRTGPALVATGALVQVLGRRQETVKSEFAQRFTEFVSADNQKLYRQLFSDGNMDRRLA